MRQEREKEGGGEGRRQGSKKEAGKGEGGTERSVAGDRRDGVGVSGHIKSPSRFRLAATELHWLRFRGFIGVRLSQFKTECCQGVSNFLFINLLVSGV
ncbi:hypothetical protein Pmani_000764 [Petrolisthes manimaculis]|uniref:Uncharacterized protein n=1 Tax=Petrolisthes manimaculis TaxID=1843537 RepID=A0AAE1UKZ0_9EUCA|nr:hypothetical protein Pmani_000764 [Petrolisthes manimaculis]